MVKFRHQFSEECSIQLIPPIDNTPFEGFSDEGVMPISELIRRMSVGQDVPMFSEGVYEDEQLFHTEFIDQFDYMDMVEAASEKQAESQEQKTAPQEKQTEPALPANGDPAD